MFVVGLNLQKKKGKGKRGKRKGEKAIKKSESGSVMIVCNTSPNDPNEKKAYYTESAPAISKEKSRPGSKESYQSQR